MRSVVITGIGIVSCLGTGAEKVSCSLREGRSGIVLDPVRKALGFRGALTGAISDFTPPPLDRKSRRTLTDFGVWAYAAALESIAMAGWSEEQVRDGRTGLIIGNDSAVRAGHEQVNVTEREKSTFSLGGSLVFQALNSTVTMNLNAMLGVRGASWTLSAACASGGHSIGQAAGLIALGQQDRMLCGGTQEMCWEAVASFDATNAFSTRHESPSEASRPFDAERDGLVPSGGAAMIALESEEMARARGANILGRVAGYAFSSDGTSLNVPSGEGIERAMRECLRGANVDAAAIDYVSAHATSTPIGDLVEARAIANVFGEDGAGPWVSSIKGMTGHEMWMAGAAQVVYCVLMGRDGFIAPNLNFKNRSDDMPRLRIAAETIARAPRLVMCNAAGFGGTNSVLLIEMRP